MVLLVIALMIIISVVLIKTTVDWHIYRDPIKTSLMYVLLMALIITISAIAS